MAGTLKTSQFNSATVANPTDEVPLLQGGQLKRVQVKVLTGNPDVGWQGSGESWAFSSYSSTTRRGVVTVPSDATVKYNVGMKVRFSQATGGTKYGRVVAVTSTTLTIFMLNGATLTNETISSPVYSPLAAPVAPNIDWNEQEPIIAPTLTNSWVNYAGNFRSAGYWKDVNGIVHCCGIIKSGTTNNPMFTLPAGYRPSATIGFATNTDTGLGNLQVLSSGVVQISSGGNGFVYLDAIQFRAEA